MSHQIDWYVQKRVLIDRLRGPLRLIDLRQNLQATLQLARLESSPVHLVIDLRALSAYPMPLGEFMTVFKPLRCDPCLKSAILVTDNPVLRFVASVTPGGNMLPFVAVDNMAAVNEVLKRADRSLLTLLPNPTLFPIYQQ